MTLCLSAAVKDDLSAVVMRGVMIALGRLTVSF